MAYQKVGTPRFYIDTMQYLKNLDVNITYDESYIEEGICEKLYNNNLSPENPVLFSSSTGTYAINTLIFENDKIISKLKEGNCYLALLNHNLSTAVEDAIFWAQFQKEDGSGGYSEYKPQALEGINAEVDKNNDSRGSFNPNKNGFSIGTFSCDETEVDRFYFGIAKSGYVAFEELAEIYIGGVSFGKYYDMPVNPDLDLSMSIEYDGFTNIKTLSGHTITQANYQGSPWWYDKNGNKVEPWSVGQSTGISKRNGRRVWKLKFSYMSNRDLFASNYGSSTYAEHGDPTTGAPFSTINLLYMGYYQDDVDTMNWGQNLITNGTFDSNLDSWNEQGDGSQWTHSSDDGGVARFEADTQTGIWQPVHPLAGQSAYPKDTVYQITYTANITSGNYDTLDKDSSRVDLYHGTHTVETTLLNGSFYIKPSGSGGIATFDNISVRQANHSDFAYTIDNDDSFSAQVLNKISHGEKFIFQPDNTSNNPSDFAICGLDGDSFEMKRTAPNVYDIEMTIREVW